MKGADRSDQGVHVRALVLSDIPLFAFNLCTSLGLAGIASDVMCTRRWSPARLSRFCRRYERIDAADLHRLDPALAGRIAQHCEDRGLDIIVPADLEAARFVIHHRAALGPAARFPLPDAATLDRLHHKAAFSQLLESVDVPHPMTRMLDGAADVAALDVPPPWVIKPPASASGVGVQALRNRAELQRYLENQPPAQAYPRLIQQFVPGEDGDLTLLADRGNVVASTVQYRRGAAGVQFVRDDQIVEMGRQIIAAARYHGVLDFDFRRDAASGRVWIIECNPRFPGTILYKTWAGVNLPHMAVQLAMGEPVKFTPVEGPCADCGLAPRATLRGLLRGSLEPLGLPPFTHACRAAAMRDPLPHLWRWFSGMTDRLRGTRPLMSDTPASFEASPSPAPAN